VFLPSPVGQITSAVFHKIFDLSVLGTLLSSQAAASRRREGGSIVNVSSVVANMGLPGTAVYAASKGAIDAATRVLASELAPKKIRVNSVNPGLVVTPATEAVGFTTGDSAQFWINAAALRRPGLRYAGRACHPTLLP